MAFPSDHVYPGDLPFWLLADNQFTAGTRAEPTQYEQGEDRHREIYTFTPYPVSLSVTLTTAQYERFVNWYEEEVSSGAGLFDVEVPAINGMASQWWQAMFMGPFRVESINTRLHTVTAELILLDGPYDADNLPPGSSPGDPPRVAPTVRARVVGDESRITARAESPSLRARIDGDSEIWAMFDDRIRARIDGDSEIRATVDTGSYILLESGDYLLIEDDAFELEDGDSLLLEDGGAFFLEGENRVNQE